MFNELKEKYKKQYTDRTYEDLLLTDIASMFDWTFSEEIDTRFIESYLLIFGECAIWRLDGKLIVSVCNRAGSPNVNGLGKDLICITGNGVSKTFTDFENRTDVVYIRNNKFATPDLNIEPTASILSELYTSLRHNIINARYTPIVVAHDSRAKTAIEQVLKSNNSAEIQVVLSDNIFDTEKENVLNVTDVNAQDKIQYINHAHDDVLRQFYSIYGLDTCGTSKMAQQSADEINAGCNARMVLPLDRLKERQESAQKISDFFGIECSVEFSEAWRREFDRVTPHAETTAQRRPRQKVRAKRMALFNLLQLVNVLELSDFDMTVNNIPIYTGQDFYQIVRARYSHMLFETPENNIDYAKQDLKNIYAMWKRLNGEDFLRIYNAMRSEYSPLENYDRLEEGATETARHKGTRTSQNVDITNTPTVTTKTTEKVNASDGGVVESMETETANTSGNTVTSGSANTNYTETRDISDTVYDRDIETFNGRRTHGNIGVVTTQTLITEEINLRLLGFIETIISQFVEKFTFYVSGV